MIIVCCFGVMVVLRGVVVRGVCVCVSVFGVGDGGPWMHILCIGEVEDVKEHGRCWCYNYVIWIHQYCVHTFNNNSFIK